MIHYLILFISIPNLENKINSEDLLEVNQMKETKRGLLSANLVSMKVIGIDMSQKRPFKTSIQLEKNATMIVKVIIVA